MEAIGRAVGREGRPSWAEANGPRTLVLSSLGHAVVDASWFLLPLMIPLMRNDLGLNYTQSGLLVTVYLTVCACVAYVAGRLSDTWGRRRLISGGFLVGAGGFALVGLSRSYVELVCSLVVAGLGTATFHPCAYASLNETYASRRGTAFGRFESSSALGVLVTLLLRGALFARASWRNVSVGAAVALGLAAVMNAVFWPNDARRRDAAGPAAPPASTLPSGGRRHRVALVGGLFTPLSVLLVALGLRAFGATALLNFLPTFLADVRGFGASQVSYGSAFLYVGAAVGAAMWGVAADLGDASAVTKGLFIGLVPASVLLGLVPAGWSLFTVLAAYGALSAGTFPAQCVVASDININNTNGNGGSAAAGGLFGTIMSVFNLVAAVGPWAAGALADATTLPTAFRLATVPMGLAALTLCFLPRANATPGCGRHRVLGGREGCRGPGLK